MYKIVNPVAPFQPYDVCRVKNTGTICVVTEVNLNTSQEDDIYQWSFSIRKFDRDAPDRTAWYKTEELEYLNNIFEIIASESTHPFSASSYELRLPRR